MSSDFLFFDPNIMNFNIFVLFFGIFIPGYFSFILLKNHFHEIASDIDIIGKNFHKIIIIFIIGLIEFLFASIQVTTYNKEILPLDLPYYTIAHLYKLIILVFCSLIIWNMFDKKIENYTKKINNEYLKKIVPLFAYLLLGFIIIYFIWGFFSPPYYLAKFLVGIINLFGNLFVIVFHHPTTSAILIDHTTNLDLIVSNNEENPIFIQYLLGNCSNIFTTMPNEGKFPMKIEANDAIFITENKSGMCNYPYKIGIVGNQMTEWICNKIPGQDKKCYIEFQPWKVNIWN
ncbi:MAG: hypothetical protein AABX01_08355 [Candidatus Micrarchaeota archaeon]